MASFPSPTRRRFLTDLGALAVSGGFLRHRGLDGEPGPVLTEYRTASEYLFGKGVVYLNTAALGPTPRRIVERTLAASHDLESNPSFHGYGRLKEAMDGVRARAAVFLGCTLDEMVITRSTTEGINTVAQGLNISAGHRVLMSDQEHPGGQMGWKHLARRHGVIVDTIALPLDDHDPQSIVGRYAAAITPTTRAISVSHVLSSTGMRMPIRELSALARAHGCLCVVDGAQAAGAIQVNVKELGCHAYATSGHKWLLGPKGTGLLYLSAETTGVIDPMLLEDGRGAYVESTGVRGIAEVIGLGAAIDSMTSLGMSTAESRATGLRNQVVTALGSVPRLTIVSPPPGPTATPIVTYRVPDTVDSAALVVALREKHHVIVKPVPKDWLNGIRISAHIFNSQRDIDQLTRALRVELR
jgi:selenocysteine lyase/cysteine desulfurase